MTSTPPHAAPWRGLSKAAEPRLAIVHAAVLAAILAWMLIGLAAQLHVLLTEPVERSVDLLFDDAYYYLGVAWNLAHHHRSSFTEPLPTNGYHPLWLLILTGLTLVFDLSRQGLVLTTLILTAALKCVGVWLFDRDQPDAMRRTFGRIAIFIVMFKYSSVFSVGMETTLFIIFIPWLLRAAQRDEASAWRGVTLGLLMSAVFLSRLDALSLDVAVLGVALVMRRLSIRHAMLALIPLLLTLAIYASINAYFFGTPLPVSGQAKAIGSRFGANLDTSLDFIINLRWPAMMLALWAAARLTVARRLTAPFFELTCLALATGACALYYGLLSGWPVWGWYLYPNAYLSIYATMAGACGLMAFFLAGRSALTARPAARGVYQIACALLVAGVATMNLARMVRNERVVVEHLAHRYLHRDIAMPGFRSYNSVSVSFIPWLTARYPAGAVIAMGDRAGGLGYWMPDRNSMLQVEGLVTDKAFLEVLNAGALLPYLEAQHVDLYIVDRSHAFVSGDVLGFVEPAQARVTLGPLNILCFDKRAQLLKYDYLYVDGPQQRWVFDFRQHMACPADLMAHAMLLEGQYDGLRNYSTW